MSARTDLADLIAQDAPDTWEIYAYPASLAPFDDATKPVAVVVEQRTIAAGTTSPDANGLPVGVELLVWVVVDGALGDNPADLEDTLEAAAETMIRLLEPLHGHEWNGDAIRDNYDTQKPAYQFTIRATGAITEETP